jgi:hypothetical protein
MPPNPISFPHVKDALLRTSAGGRATTPTLNAVDLMRFWLWGSDANEVCDRNKCDFHLMHLTGILCVRVLTEAYHSTTDSIDVVPVIIDLADIELLIAECGIFIPHFYRPSTVESSPTGPQTVQGAVDVPSCVSLQQLRDIVHAVQTQWPVLQAAIARSDCLGENIILQTVDRLVTQLFVWFGTFLFSSNIEEWQADDEDFVDKSPPMHNLILTDMGIKFYLNIFFVLFRLLFLQRHAIPVPAHLTILQKPVCMADSPPPEEDPPPPLADLSVGTVYPFDIESFHVEAGVDDFHMIGMYFDIPAGCLLEYKHSYSGYYNNVSQCVYRHFPSYKRRLPVSLDEILLKDASDLSVLPALKQIYPEIEFAFEDHHFYREVGSVRTAVLLSHGKSQQAHKTAVVSLGNQKPQNSTNSQSMRSENLLARVAACTGGMGDADSSGTEGVDGKYSARNTDWFWFVIGGNIYLVCTVDGVAYSGSCRDLLTFYLTKLVS